MNHRQGDTKKGKNVRADENRREQKNKSADGDSLGERAAHFRRAPRGHGKKDRRAAQRIYDRQERSDHEQHDFTRRDKFDFHRLPL
jgi:hypothetical protein